MTTQTAFSSIETAFSQALESALNKAIQLDAENAYGFQALDGKVVALDIAPFKHPFYLLINCDKQRCDLAVQQTLNGQPDLSVKAPLEQWLNIALASLSHTQKPFVAQPIENSHSESSQNQTSDHDEDKTKHNPEHTAQELELIAQFNQAINAMDIDLEEWLSHYTGDLLAFKIGHGLRTVLDSSQEIKDSAKSQISQTVREYLLFEINALPAPHQVQQLFTEIEQTQNSVDAIEQRIAKLRQTFSSEANRL